MNRTYWNESIDPSDIPRHGLSYLYSSSESMDDDDEYSLISRHLSLPSHMFLLCSGESDTHSSQQHTHRVTHVTTHHGCWFLPVCSTEWLLFCEKLQQNYFIHSKSIVIKELHKQFCTILIISWVIRVVVNDSVCKCIEWAIVEDCVQTRVKCNVTGTNSWGYWIRSNLLNQIHTRTLSFKKSKTPIYNRNCRLRTRTNVSL